MNETLKYLCENIQGCKIGYTQSDEITLLLTDYDTLTTAAWFDYAVQKMCSVAASMATLKFNQTLHNLVNKWEFDICPFVDYRKDQEAFDYMESLEAAVRKGAMFDARCFNIPEDEVVNCFIWRQQDATRNAIQMLGQCNFSHKELNGRTCSSIKAMLAVEKGINFDDMPTEFKRGVCCVKKEFIDETMEGLPLRSQWVIDKEIPIFTQDRGYIEESFKGGKNES